MRPQDPSMCFVDYVLGQTCADETCRELGKAGSPHPGADIEPLEDTIKPPPAKGKGKAKGKKQGRLSLIDLRHSLMYF